MMKYKDFKKLMSVSLNSLSRGDQVKRQGELQKRLRLCYGLLEGMTSGYIPEEVEDDLDDDDPLKEMIQLYRIKLHEPTGEA